MPQVFKRRGSPNYYARFQVDGQDYVLSTGTAKRSEATAIMRRLLAEKKGTLAVGEMFDALLRELSRQEKTADSAARKRELLSLRQDMGRQILGAQADKLALKDAWKAWLDNPKKRNPGAATIRNYHSEWARFLAWAQKQDLRFLHEITAVKAEEYAQD